MIEMSVGYAPLTSECCREWATMAYWNVIEGIFLSMGLNPKSGQETEDDVAKKRGDEFLKRLDKFTRSQCMPANNNRLATIAIDDPHPSFNPEEDERQIVVCVPAIFTKWAKKVFLSFPEELCEAVKAFSPESFADEKKFNKTEALTTGSSLAKELADKRWKANREMSVKAEYYVKEQLQHGCLCDHALLADFMTNNAFDDGGSLIFNDADIPEKTMPSLLRKAAKKVFTELAPGRIRGNKGAAKSDEPCRLHPEK